MATHIHTEKVQIQVPGAERPMRAYLAVPDGAGPFPAVIVFEEIFGLTHHIREVTERVAKDGYVAIAPDYHHRAAPTPDFEFPYNQEGMQKGMALIGKLTQAGFEADVKATLALLHARKDVRADRIGCMGFCIGGHAAFMAATLPDIRATASFYGGGIATFGPGGGAPTVTRAGEIHGRIVCFFGGNDPLIPKEQVQKIEHALAEHGVRHEVVTYEGASHAFFCDDAQRGAWVPDAARDAWARTQRLFAEELKK